MQRINTDLNEAIHNDKSALVKQLLKNKAAVDQKNWNGNTGLMKAASFGYTKIVEQLLVAGASLTLQGDRNGHTALMMAVLGGHSRIVERLLVAGAAVDIQSDINGNTALMLAVYCGHTNIVELLLAADAAVDLQTHKGYTALMTAACKGHTKIVELLLAAGAAVDLQTHEGYTALMTAACKGHTKIVELLLAAGATVDFQMNDGTTPLMMAACKDYAKIVELLLAAGATIDLKAKCGGSALSGAGAYGHIEIERMLKQKQEEAKEYQTKFSLNYYQISLWKIPAVQGLFAFCISKKYFPKNLYCIIAAYLLPTHLKEDKAIFSKEAEQLFNKMQFGMEKNNLAIDLRGLQSRSLLTWFKNKKEYELAFRVAKTEAEMIALLLENLALMDPTPKKS